MSDSSMGAGMPGRAGSLPATARPGESPATLKRGFTFRSAFSLAFADVSPIVALYTVFSIVVALAGVGFWWAFPIVLGGQLLVAAVFGDVSSRFPLAGSVYQWSRYLVGPRYGWYTAWAYIWGLSIALSALAYGAAGFLLGAAGVAAPSHLAQALVALALVAFATGLNVAGRIFLKIFLGLSIAAEVIGSVGLGTYLLVRYQVNPLSALVHSAGAVHGSAWLTGPFIAAIAVVGWSFLGFESAGSIAEEVHEPARNVPKAIVLSLLCVGLVVLYSGLALALAVPDVGAVLAGRVPDPIGATLAAHLGSGAARGFEVLFLFGFLASFTAVQSAVSRCIWANARDRVLPGHSFLIRVSRRERLPYNSIMVTAVIAAVLPFISTSKVYAVLISFTNAGFYMAFALPVFGALYIRARGRWQPGPWTLGRWGGLITGIAAVWLAAEIVNIAWPRSALYGTGILSWSVLLMMGILAVAGLAINAWVFREDGRHTRQGELIITPP
ncbi:MAG: amino acid permease [Actinobacteria bacterium]|nr:amino acid permease [Actinomycetota bacterium]MBO0785705.1 amino acid permease [Actinomycetota bacterium]